MFYVQAAVSLQHCRSPQLARWVSRGCKVFALRLQLEGKGRAEGQGRAEGAQGQDEEEAGQRHRIHSSLLKATVDLAEEQASRAKARGGAEFSRQQTLVLKLGGASKDTPSSRMGTTLTGEQEELVVSTLILIDVTCVTQCAIACAARLAHFG